MNKPVMQRTNSRTIFDLSLSLRPSLHKNKPGVHLSFPPPSTCHLRDEETSLCVCVWGSVRVRAEEIPRRGDTDIPGV